MISSPRLPASLTALFFAAAMAANAVPELIVPTSLVKSPTSSHTDFFSVANLVDGSGLSGTPTISNFLTITHDHVFLPSGSNVWATESVGQDYFVGGPAPVLDASFASTAYHTGIVIWGFYLNPGSPFGDEAKAFELQFSTDGGTTFSPASETLFTAAPLVEGSVRLDFSAPRVANFIRITITDNHFGSSGVNDGGTRVGLGEIRFIIDEPAPVPALSHLPEPDPVTDRQINLGAHAPSNSFHSAAQSFDTGSVRLPLKSITLRLRNDDVSASSARVKLWTGPGSQPTILTEDLGVIPGISSDVDAEYTIQSKNRPILEPNTRYWVAVSRETGSFLWRNNDTTQPSGSATMALPSVRATSPDGNGSWTPFNTSSNYRQFMEVVGFSGAVVSNSSDSGPGSLRDAIAEVSPGGRITFDPSLDGQSIVLEDTQLTIDKDLTIDASSLPNLITILGTGQSRIFDILAGNEVTLDSLVITGGVASGGQPDSFGGGIRNRSNLTIHRSTISGNLAQFGGGIFNYGDGELGILNSTISGNTSTSSGGGIFNDDNGYLNVVNATFTGNHAVFSGGGIYNDATHGTSTVTLTYATIVGNSAASNTSPSVVGGGGIASLETTGTATLVLTNSIIAGNTSGKMGPDILKNGIVSSDTNLIGDNTDSGLDGSSGLIGTSASPVHPLLAALGNYGGPTLTMPPTPGSPAIDAAFSPSTEEDQRGLPRGESADLGATEYQGTDDLVLFWDLDPDRDGSPVGVEEALGTVHGTPDAGSDRNLRFTRNAQGRPVLTFGRNNGALPGIRWVLARSPDLSSGSFTEIFRFDGTNTVPASPTAQVGFTVGTDSISVTDLAPPPGQAYYRFESLKPGSP